MQDPFTTEIYVITALDGREIDIMEQVEKLSAIGRYFRDDSQPSPGASRIVYKIGWHVVLLCGLDEAMALIDDMIEDKDINPAFGDYVRGRWIEADTKIRAAQA